LAGILLKIMIMQTSDPQCQLSNRVVRCGGCKFSIDSRHADF